MKGDVHVKLEPGAHPVPAAVAQVEKAEEEESYDEVKALLEKTGSDVTGPCDFCEAKRLMLLYSKRITANFEVVLIQTPILQNSNPRIW